MVFFVAVWGHYFHSSLTENRDGFQKLGSERFLTDRREELCKRIAFLKSASFPGNQVVMQHASIKMCRKQIM